MLLRPANDSIRPLSTIELALKIRPAPASSLVSPVWRLDPQYEQWLAQHFPQAQVWFCPLDIYDRMVRPADAPYTLDQMDESLREEARRTGGFALGDAGGRPRRTAMFVVGSLRLKALVDFLFQWG